MLLALRSLWEPAGPAVTALTPGRVIKGRYPYWKPRKPFKLPEHGRPPGSVTRDDSLTEEEFLFIASIDLD